jgi:hypothetical protein
LDVLRFVERRTREEGRRPPWRILLKRWNEEQSTVKDRFRDLRNFARVYRETLDRVAHYSFYLPRRNPSSPAAKKRDKKVAEGEAYMRRVATSLRAQIEEHGNRGPEQE